jgi:vancomycin resistance protein YoaR
MGREALGRLADTLARDMYLRRFQLTAAGVPVYDLPASPDWLAADKARIWDAARLPGRQGGWRRRAADRMALLRRGKAIPLFWAIDEARLGQLLEAPLAGLETPPVNAGLEADESGRLTFIPQTDGRRPDAASVLAEIRRSLDPYAAPPEGWTAGAPLRIEVSFQKVAADITQEDLNGDGTMGLTAQSVTYYDSNKRTRAQNIALAAQRMHQSLIPPGGVFSFNQVVGERTAEQGFQIADTIVGGRIVPDVGGGICQVSSTLYQNVLSLGLEVLKRHPHSMLVSYVQPGLDATVAYDFLDFQFRNHSAGWLLITSTAREGALRIRFYSCKPPYTVRINREETWNENGVTVKVERLFYGSRGDLAFREPISEDAYVTAPAGPP